MGLYNVNYYSYDYYSGLFGRINTRKMSDFNFRHQRLSENMHSFLYGEMTIVYHKCYCVIRPLSYLVHCNTVHYEEIFVSLHLLFVFCLRLFLPGDYTSALI